jgi:aminopeptidase N
MTGRPTPAVRRFGRAVLAAAVLAGAALVAGCDGGGAGAVAPDATIAAPTTPPAALAPVTLDPANGRSHPVADPVYPQQGNPAVDVLVYDLDLSWDPAARRLSGQAMLTVRATKQINEITLDFSGALHADKVTVDGQPATAEQAADNITVPLPHQLAADDQVRLAITYGGSPKATAAPMVRADIEQVGLIVEPDGSAFALQQPYGAFTWYPVNDQPSDEALYDVSVTVPAGWAAVSGGDPQPVAGAADGGHTYRYLNGQPVASYLVTFGVGRYRHTVAAGPHGLPMHFWYLPAEADMIEQRIAPMAEMISWLEQRFGPYPFRTIGLMTIPLPTGMETQTMMTLNVGFPDEVLVHELAHHWFGDAVTPRTWRDMWLNEGWAMYVQALWEDEFGSGRSKDPVPLARTLAEWRSLDGELRAAHGPPADYRPGHFGSANVYYCPGLMLHEIRRQVGDRMFFAMARDWVQTNRDTTQDRASFTAFVNKQTGRDLTPLINAWLDSPTTPAAAG